MDPAADRFPLFELLEPRLLLSHVPILPAALGGLASTFMQGLQSHGFVTPALRSYSEAGGADLGDTFADAGAIGVWPSVETRVRGTLTGKGDVDMLSFVAPVSGTMDVSLQMGWRNQGQISAFDAAGKRLAKATEGKKAGADIAFDVQAGQTYYLRVTSLDPKKKALYKLRLRLTETVDPKPVNLAPEALNDAFAVDEDSTLTVSLGVLANDTDPDGDALTAVLVDGVSNGSLVLNDDGSFAYTPDADFFGTDSFTYKANDGQADSGVATVTIAVGAVNDAPIAQADAYRVDEDNPLTAEVGVLANDADTEGDVLTAVLGRDVSSGRLVLNDDGTFSYTPDANFNGTDSFTYTASDRQANSDPTTVTITVSAVNDAPTALAEAYTIDEDTVLTAETGVLANDTDVDGDALSAVLVRDASNGSLVFSADGSFVYTPDADFSGTDTFIYKATDGAADSNLSMVTIRVNPVNDAPVASEDHFSMYENDRLQLAPAGMLANDIDADGDALSAVIVDQPQHGSITVSPDGTVTYTPDAGFIGTDTLTYKASDGVAESDLATVSITVSPFNHPPVANDDAYVLGEGTALTVSMPGILINDYDADGDWLFAVVVGDVANGTLTRDPLGGFTYTPDDGFTGIDTFTYMAVDQTDFSNVATVTLTVMPAEESLLA